MPETNFAPWTNVCVLVSSNNMLAHGRQKVAAAGFSARSVRLVKGDAQDLSRTLATDTLFDAATMAFAIRNVPDRLKALKSIRSHLKPGARFAILGSLRVVTNPVPARSRLCRRLSAHLASDFSLPLVVSSLKAAASPDQHVPSACFGHPSKAFYSIK